MRCKLFALIALVLTIHSQSFQQLGIILIHDVETNPGLITAYINRLTQTNCAHVSEFNVLSSYRQSMEISDLQETAATLPIPVHFDFIVPAESYMRLRVAAGSAAELYLVGSLAGDTCQQIEEYLQFARTHEAAGLIPLVGEIEQASVITVDNSQKVFQKYFGYAKESRLKHFQIVENIRLLSRHTLQLAASTIREVKLMADHPPVCQEIFLNFVHAHFYPELRSRLLKFSKNLQVVEIKRMSGLKEDCVRSFIEILGYCPLFYQKKVFDGKIWKNPNFEQVVQLKRVALNSQIMMENETRLLVTETQHEQQSIVGIDQMTHIQITILTTLIIVIGALLSSIVILRIKINSLSPPKTSVAAPIQSAK